MLDMDGVFFAVGAIAEGNTSPRPPQTEPIIEEILEPRTAADSSPTLKRLKVWGKVSVPVHQGRDQVVAHRKAFSRTFSTSIDYQCTNPQAGRPTEGFVAIFPS